MNLIYSIYAPEAAEKLDPFLLENQLSFAEFWIVEQLGTEWHMPPCQLIQRCENEARMWQARLGDGCWGGDECELQAAFQSLEQRGLIQVIDEEALATIIRYLENAPLAWGPMDGLPSVGDVDFTLQGGELYRQTLIKVFNRSDSNLEMSCIQRPDDNHVEVYGTSREHAAEGFYDCVFLDDSQLVINASDIEPIEAWRDRWWNTIPQGWRIVAEVKQKSEDMGDRSP